MNQEETSRRFDTTQHPFACGLDRHARLMDVCLRAQSGEVLGPRPLTTAPATFLPAMAPSRPGIGGAVAGRCPWDWLAALCAADGIPAVLGPALALQALHGGQATHDQSDAPTLAALRRGGRLPQASVSPATRRATRDWRRRQMPLAPHRAALLAHVPPPNRP
jgi:hypothetical protein